MTTNNIVTIESLNVTVGASRIIDDMSLVIPKGSITAIVGESGSGKTTLALAMMGLLSNAMRLTAKRIDVVGVDLINATEEQQRSLCGYKVGFAFQETLAAFDPLLTVGYQMREAFGAHQQFNQVTFNQRISDIFNLVGLSAQQQLLTRYPHEISGGQRQRLMLALAALHYPSLLIADEPTSSLDYHLRDQIVLALKQLNKQLSMSMVVITHDFAVVKALASHVMVLKQGRIVEQGLVNELMHNPQDLYTKQLIEAS